MSTPVIRTARKAGKCAEYRRCGNMINKGDSYVEGDMDPYKAGGFGFDRLCMACGDEYINWQRSREVEATRPSYESAAA